MKRRADAGLDVDDRTSGRYTGVREDGMVDDAAGLWQMGLICADALRVLGLRTVLGDGTELEIVCLSAADALRSRLDVVLIDAVATPQLFDLMAALRVDRPEMRLLVMGPEMDLEHIERVIGAGAKGYLTRVASETEVKMALSVVREGSVWAPRKVMARLLSQRADVSPKKPEGQTFTPREVQVLKLLVLGHPNRDIGVVLGVDEATVKAHVGRLMRKFGVRNRTELAMHSLERKLE